MNKHVLYKNGDIDAPKSVLDSNGEIVLSLCRNCKEGEAGLADSCPEAYTIEVSTPAWSDAAKSWYFLTQKSENGVGWSGGVWFPKKVCILDEEKGLLTLPKWLYDKKTQEGAKLKIIE